MNISCLYYIWNWYSRDFAALLIWLHDSTSWKKAEDGPSTLDPVTMWETQGVLPWLWLPFGMWTRGWKGSLSLSGYIYLFLCFYLFINLLFKQIYILKIKLKLCFYVTFSNIHKTLEFSHKSKVIFHGNTFLSERFVYK